MTNSPIDNEKGDMFLEAIISLIIIFSVFVSAINLFSLVMQKQSIDNMSMELARCIQMNGEVNAAYDNLYQTMTERMTPKPDVAITADYIGNTKKIQLGSAIKVEMKMPAVCLGFTIEIIGRGYGSSEVYHKT